MWWVGCNVSSRLANRCKYTSCGILIDMWTIELELVKDWLNSLDRESKIQVLAALEILKEQGPNLKRPLVGKINGSRLVRSMKELRPGSAGQSEIRILFVFDPKRKAILLVGGDKQAKWNKWYKTAIPEAERRYVAWLENQYGKETK